MMTLGLGEETGIWATVAGVSRVAVATGLAEANATAQRDSTSGNALRPRFGYTDGQ